MDKIYFLFVLFTSNNVFVTITNYKGKVIIWRSLGKFKIKGLRKLTPTFIKSLIYDLKLIFKFYNKLHLHIKIKGFNKCKKNTIKFLVEEDFFTILSISDYYLHSNNGCKLKKSRRL